MTTAVTFSRYIRWALATGLALLLCAGPLQADEPKWTVNFNDSDITEVIKFVADATGKTMVIDPRVKGKVQVISAKSLNAQELYDLFLSVLEIHGFAAYEQGKVVRVVPNKEVRSVAIPTQTGATSNEEYMTQVIQLKNISAAKILPAIRPLVPQHAHVAAYDPSNAIVITDNKANIERMKKVIALIDDAAVASTEVLQLKYASASQIVDMINQLYQSGDAMGGNLRLVPDDRTNTIIVGGDDLQRERVKALLARLDRPQAQSGNVRVVYLEYAKAEQVASVLSKLLQNMAKAGKTENSKAAAATVEADEDTNALLITAEGDVLDSLLAVVDRLDIRRAQVLVEAIIVEMIDDVGKELGVQWLFQNDTGGFGSSSQGNGSLGTVAAAALNDDDGALSDLASALSSLSGQALSFGDTEGNNKFVGLITALNATAGTNVLSTPSLLTLDNNEASISVGSEVPFVTGSYTTSNGDASNPFQTIERQNVGIVLNVTPHVNEGNKIMLDIEQEISSVSEDARAADIVTNERKIKTQVLSHDGQIVVLGGLIKDDAQVNEQRVPVLGSIPLLGRLFRSESNSIEKTHLLVFIRATVIRDDETLTGATAEKYQFIREQQLKQRDKKALMLDEKLLPLLPEFNTYDKPDASGAIEESTSDKAGE